jgi:hypothetical protein
MHFAVSRLHELTGTNFIINERHIPQPSREAENFNGEYKVHESKIFRSFFCKYSLEIFRSVLLLRLKTENDEKGNYPDVLLMKSHVDIGYHVSLQIS